MRKSFFIRASVAIKIKVLAAKKQQKFPLETITLFSSYHKILNC